MQLWQLWDSWRSQETAIEKKISNPRLGGWLLGGDYRRPRAARITACHRSAEYSRVTFRRLLGRRTTREKFVESR